MDDVIEELDALEGGIPQGDEQGDVRRIRRMVERVPGSKQIQKYTPRDMGEAFIGGLVFSLPLLVEDGVFEIAEWFTRYTVGPFPALLLLNVLLIIMVTAGLLYVVDIRDVQISRPLFGIIPRRLVGVLGISFLCAAGMMLLWGRLHEGDPTTVEAFSRVSVIWASAALGAVLTDILPGESKGQDVSDLIREDDHP